MIIWQEVGSCCEQTHAAFEVGLSLDKEMVSIAASQT